MRYISSFVLITLLLGVLGNDLLSQKYDNTWLIGIGRQIKPCMIIDFASSRPIIKTESRLQNLLAHTCAMSDSFGNLKFYSNGLHVYNSQYEIMKNGDTINPGITWELSHGDVDFYVGFFPPRSIPYPGHKDEYLMFHMGMEDFYSVDIRSVYNKFYLSRIDIDQENGYGAVIEKNIILADTNANYGDFALVKHGNGRDWWCFTFDTHNNKYFQYLIDPYGIHKEELEFDEELGVNIPWIGRPRMKFSTNGKTLAFSPNPRRLILFDFDRCDGSFSKKRTINPPISPDLTRVSSRSSIEFSPNSKFLYFNNINEIYQINLEEGAELENPICISESDDHWQTLNTNFIVSQLGPDGKIYLSSGNGNEILHVINRPNLPGMSCDVQQHGVLLPEENFLGLPRFPNYRLGALEGSPCDTLEGKKYEAEIIDSLNGDFEFGGKWYKRALRQ